MRGIVFLGGFLVSLRLVVVKDINAFFFPAWRETRLAHLLALVLDA